MIPKVAATPLTTETLPDVYRPIAVRFPTASRQITEHALTRETSVNGSL